jgi:hypothetical protein
MNAYQKLVQPHTEGFTYGKDPGWGWSRDITKIQWRRWEGRVSNCMLAQLQAVYSE